MNQVLWSDWAVTVPLCALVSAAACSSLVTLIMPNEVHMTCTLSFEVSFLHPSQCLIGYNYTLMPLGRSMKIRSSSLTRVSVGRAQTPPKPDKGTTEDQGGWRKRWSVFFMPSSALHSAPFWNNMHVAMALTASSFWICSFYQQEVFGIPFGCSLVSLSKWVYKLSSSFFLL